MIIGINWLDIFYLILLLGMVYRGSKVGVGGQIPSLAGYFILIFFSIGFYIPFSESIFAFLLQKWAKPISFFVLAGGIFAGIKVVEKFFGIVVEEHIAQVEKIGGCLMAAFRASVLFGLVGMLFLLMPINYARNSVQGSSMITMRLVEFNAGIYTWIESLFGKEDRRTRQEVVKEFIYSVKD